MTSSALPRSPDVASHEIWRRRNRARSIVMSCAAARRLASELHLMAVATSNGVSTSLSSLAREGRLSLSANDSRRSAQRRGRGAASGLARRRVAIVAASGMARQGVSIFCHHRHSRGNCLCRRPYRPSSCGSRRRFMVTRGAEIAVRRLRARKCAWRRGVASSAYVCAGAPHRESVTSRVARHLGGQQAKKRLLGEPWLAARQENGGVKANSAKRNGGS